MSHKITRLLLVLYLACVPLLFSQDKAAIDQDVRAAMQHVGFRDHALTLQAEFAIPGSPNGYAGKYQLRWQSPQNWFDRVDYGPFALIRIAEGEKLFTKDNTSKPFYAELLVLRAFGPSLPWGDGSEWKLKSAKARSLRSAKTVCATYGKEDKAGKLTTRELEVCLDPDTKDVVQAGPIYFSEFTTLAGRRYPQKIEIREGEQKSAEFTASIKSLLPNAEIPRAPAGVREQLNCTQLVHEEVLKNKVIPAYPFIAKSEHQQGTVVLVTTIGTDGRVTIHGIGQSAGKLLDDASVEAVRQWTYEPALCGSVPIPDETLITVHYTLSP